MNILEQTLGQLAREIPGATAVFHNHQLDFCCGGEQTLAQASERKKLDAEGIVAELVALHCHTEEAELWRAASNSELIAHILSRYHDVHRQQLPELIRLSARVEQVHGGHPECPTGLADHLEQLQAELLTHMQKEERILFPMIAQGTTAMALGPVSMMRHEHDGHGEAIAELGRITGNITLPDGACNTWQALYAGLNTLVVDLMDHIHLENTVLFDRIDAQGGLAHG